MCIRDSSFVENCVRLTPDYVLDFKWLPLSCAYRRIAEGKPLEPWHPLISNCSDSVHEAQISVQDKVVSEASVHENQLEDMIIKWVEYWAKTRRRHGDRYDSILDRVGCSGWRIILSKFGGFLLVAFVTWFFFEFPNEYVAFCFIDCSRANTKLRRILRAGLRCVYIWNLFPDKRFLRDERASLDPGAGWCGYFDDDSKILVL